jgi:S-(hydroxymethyl)glutathione dehydrogenase/alcohol dehydrogenase
MSTKTMAGVIFDGGKPWEVTELDLDEPKAHEVRVRVMASGLCHSDEHVREGGNWRYPMVGGHEGAGVVEAVGPDVTRVKPGDHIVTSWIPVCGHCRYCSTGHQNLCDAGLNAGSGLMQDGTFRFHHQGKDIGGMCLLGTFSQWAVIPEYSCVPIDDDLPFEVAALVGCGVTTGWGSSVYAAETRPGETVVIFGIGGVGINAVQGARFAGAKNVIAIDPVPFKLEMAKKMGATFTAENVEEARDHIRDVTRGQLADHAVITVGVMEAEVLQQAVSVIGKNSGVVVTAVGRPDTPQISLTGGPLTGWQKRIQGAIFGAANPLYDIPRLLGLYKAGDLKLDELITRRYTLEDVNDGYRDMLEGRNIRGVLIHEH